MICDDVRELEAAYALDALGEDERAAVAAHLATCNDHPDLAHMRATVLALGHAAEEEAPPEALRQRVLSSARESRSQASRPATGERHPGWGRIISGPWTLGLAAALGALAILLAVFALANRGDGDERLVRSFETDGGIEVTVDTVLGERDTRVRFANLAALPEGQEYQLWAIRGSDWLSLGRFRPNPEGGWAGDFAFAFMEGDAVYLTVWTGEGVSGPFGEPIFVEPL